MPGEPVEKVVPGPDSGVSEIYVGPFPPSPNGEKWPVSLFQTDMFVDGIRTGPRSWGIAPYVQVDRRVGYAGSELAHRNRQITLYELQESE